jgi:Fur family ferric uptake transcriptional regulator
MRQSRITRQKKLIQQKLREFKTIFTAEDLHTAVRKKDKNIGIATIYRYLKNNSVDERIHSYLCNRHHVYSTNTDNHCHFTCNICGKTEHFNISEIGFIKSRVRGDICHFQIDVYGICLKCRTGKKNTLS